MTCFRFFFFFFFTSMIHLVLKSSSSSMALQEPLTLQYWHERGKWDWISMKRPRRLAATYKQLRHHGNRQRRGRFSMGHTWGGQNDYTSHSRLAETNQILQTPPYHFFIWFSTNKNTSKEKRTFLQLAHYLIIIGIVIKNSRIINVLVLSLSVKIYSS